MNTTGSVMNQSVINISIAIRTCIHGAAGMHCRLQRLHYIIELTDIFTLRQEVTYHIVN